MNFSDRIQQYLKVRKEKLPRLYEWIAENPSRQSAMTGKTWLPRYSSANEALICIFLALFIDEWFSWELIERIGNSAYFQRYSGDWNNVQELLEQNPDLEKFEEQWNEFRSIDDFFGNFLPNCEKFLRRERRTFRSLERDLRKPKRLVRHRGYRDKGSLRPYHQRGRILPDPNPGEDRREKIKFRDYPFS